jgi:isoleucyl-tRNA synthetase
MPHQKMKYPNTKASPDFADLENNIQRFWQENKVFDKSLEQNKNNKQDKNYIFYDGPPFANGLPHYGHLLTGFVKDIFARYHTMLGSYVERKFGWDTHGLPVEMETEKELGVSGQKDITDFGIEKFNDACQKSVMKYADSWQEYVTRQGRWVDFNNGYKTMDLNYMESVIWAFKALYKKGLLYQDQRVMPYSWKCQTPLSNFETRLDNSYRQKESKSLTILFPLSDYSSLINEQLDNCFMVGWTTTPWTLPSNLALAIGKEIDYVIIKKDKNAYILAKNLLKNYQKELAEQNKEFTIIKEFKGNDLLGKKYQPLFPYWQALSVDDNGDNLPSYENIFTICHGDFVTTEEGTGIVHLAPGFGEDDQILCKEHAIPTICPVDEAGCFADISLTNKDNKEIFYPRLELCRKIDKDLPDLLTKQVFTTNDDIIIYLKKKNLWLKTTQYLHNYPHCWRSDTPLIYKAMPSWYVKVTDIKDRMVELNQQINWTPEHIKDGSFGKWLDNARDWSISRNRFWGCPVPVWKSDNPQYPRVDVYGSLDEIEQDFGVRPLNLHRPYIDELVRDNPDDPTGKSKMRRVTDVLDCWFESGSMPYAQAHYPFENKEWFEDNFPADFIVEYVAQTRGWFYTLMVLSTALFDRPPFKNCICHGVILDDKAQKLSKRLKNYIPPTEIFAKYGADAMRYYMCSATVMRGNELHIDKAGNGFKDALRLFIKPIWNSYHFFCIYANADDITAKISYDSQHIMDIYITSKVKNLLQEVKQAMDNYDLPNAYLAIEMFFDILNNWYIRRNRERFWKSDCDQSKIDAYNTLYTILNLVTKGIAPLVPHLSEVIYQGLNGSNNSVHLAVFPEVAAIPENTSLLNDMDKVRNICNVAHSIRSKENIRTRQPLSLCSIIGSNYIDLSPYKELICDEINVKNIEFIADIGDKAEFKLELNFKLLGKKYGAKLKEITKLAKQGKWQKLANNNVKIGEFILDQNEGKFLLLPKNALATQALPDQDALISLNIDLDEALIGEGIARDIVRIIQQERKNLDFNITDRINITINTDNNEIILAMKNYKDYIQKQTLANDILHEHDSDIDYNHKLPQGNLTIKLKNIS